MLGLLVNTRVMSVGFSMGVLTPSSHVKITPDANPSQGSGHAQFVVFVCLDFDLFDPVRFLVK